MKPAHELAVMAEQCSALGPRGVVCAAAPLAAQAGAAALREGGNAYDAVVAAALAHDGGRLEQLRSGLRERLRASPLIDVARFTGHLESAYRKAWEDWCRSCSE